MADREGDAPVGESVREHPPQQRLATSEPGADQDVHSPSCPECGFPRLTLVTDSEVVSVFKCPRCGHLAAPVKSP
jgi:hypothetical protein